MDHELDRFNRHVNLFEYASSQGYQLVKAESGVTCLVLQHPEGDTLIVGRATDGTWQYHSVQDPTDNGTIIEFVQRRSHQPLSSARRALLVWTQQRPHENASHEAFPITQERLAVTLAIVRAQTATRHPYLESHGLSLETLSNPRFRGSWKVADNRVLFPHRDVDGLCGFETQSAQSTGFSELGSKGLWQSQSDLADTRLVVVTTAIDALSYHQLHPKMRTRYMSVGSGALSPKQPWLIAQAIAFTERPNTIIAAASNDKAGAQLVALIRHTAHDQGLNYQRHVPERGITWTDALRSLSRQSSIRICAPKGPELER